MTEIESAKVGRWILRGLGGISRTLRDFVRSNGLLDEVSVQDLTYCLELLHAQRNYVLGQPVDEIITTPSWPER